MGAKADNKFLRLEHKIHVVSCFLHLSQLNYSHF